MPRPVAKRKKAKPLPAVGRSTDLAIRLPRSRSRSSRHCSLTRNLLRGILHYADDPTLARCVQVNRLFFYIAGPILYRTLHLEKWYSRDDVETGHQKGLHIQRENVLLKHTKVVTWRPHVGGCPPVQALTILDLPILRELDPLRGIEASKVVSPCKVDDCPFLEQLRPRKVVTNRNSSSSLVRGQGLTIKEVVYREWQGCTSYRPHVFGLAGPRVTLVLPLPRRLNIYIRSWRRPISAEERFFRPLATMSYYHIGQLTIVNTESLDRDWLEVPEGTPTQDHFRSRLFTAINEHMESHTQEERDAVHAKISFMGMREYLASHDWEGEFEPEEVKQWLD